MDFATAPASSEDVRTAIHGADFATARPSGSSKAQPSGNSTAQPSGSLAADCSAETASASGKNGSRPSDSEVVPEKRAARTAEVEDQHLLVG